MNLKKGILSLGLVVTIIATSFATATPHPTESNVASKTVDEIHQTIEKLNLDVQKFDVDKVNLKFMINENNEVIVLSTGESEIDSSLKGALNYKKVNLRLWKLKMKVSLLPLQIY